MADTNLNGRRTLEAVRRDIEAEREGLAVAVEQLRGGLGAATDVRAKVRSNLPAVAAGALGEASSSPAGSARRCAYSPARAASAEPRHRTRAVEPVAALGPRMGERLQADVQVVPGRRRDGPVRPGRVQLAARVLPGAWSSSSVCST